MPTGVTGLARPREWDATVAIELPELEGEPVSELGLVALVGEVVPGEGRFAEVCDRIAAALDLHVDRPYEAFAVRQGPTTWAAGARRVNAELVRLPGVVADSLEVALPPEADVSAAVDGRPVEGLVDPALDAALRELEARGRARFQAFVARADTVDGERFMLTIDPL